MPDNNDVTILRPMSLKTQAFRFILTGGLSAIVDLGILSLLQLVFGLPVPVARTISFIAGTTTAYMINRRWTFQAESSTSRFLAVVALYTVTFLINIGLQTLCSSLFETWGWPEAVAMVVAFVIAQGTGTTINFIVQRTLIFRVK
ncbi:GtrA family protein [Corynebacterium deserti]|uniref:GtrA family protein n=1 Tax=Corynebacterium deserti TaxID=1408191 RepID=UPI0006AD328C|nr:GtrA family protein [Corynebacterium deserti]